MSAEQVRVYPRRSASEYDKLLPHAPTYEKLPPRGGLKLGLHVVILQLRFLGTTVNVVFYPPRAHCAWNY
jgi:hypothetical protein